MKTQRITLVILGAVASLAAVLGLESGMDSTLVKLLALVIVGATIIGIAIATRPERRMPLFADPYVLSMVFLAQFYVVGPIAWYLWLRLGGPAFLYPFAPERALQVMIGFLLMLTFIVIGYHLRLGPILAERIPEFAATVRKLPGTVIEWVLVGGGLIGCLGFVWYEGGLISRLSSGYGANRPGGAMFKLAFMAVLAGTLLTAYRVISTPSRKRLNWTVFGGLLFVEALYFGIITGVRKWLLYLFFGIMAIWLLRRGLAALPKVRTAAIFAVLLVFFSVWGAVRSKPVADMASGRSDPRYQTGGAYEGYLSAVANPFGVACLVWELFPAQEPFRYGTTLGVTVFGFIPRRVWPEKPVGIGKTLTIYTDGPYFEPTHGHSIAATMLGDFYLNFGWYGVILGGLVFGTVCRTITSYAVKGMRGGLQFRAAHVLIPATFVMFLGEVRGDMSTILNHYAMSFVPILLALMFFRFDPLEPGTRAR